MRAVSNRFLNGPAFPDASRRVVAISVIGTIGDACTGTRKMRARGDLCPECRQHVHNPHRCRLVLATAVITFLTSLPIRYCGPTGRSMVVAPSHRQEMFSMKMAFRS